MSKKLVWLLEHSKVPFKVVKEEQINKKLFESSGIELSSDPDYQKAIILEAPMIEFGSDDGDNSLNENERWYSKQEYLDEVDRVQDEIKRGAMFGSPDHPEEGYSVSMKEVSHMVTKLWYNEEDNRIWIQIKVLPTIKGGGYDLIVIHKNGGLLQGSARAIGYYDEETKKATLDTFYTIDIVSNPSFKFVQFVDVDNANANQYVAEMSDEDTRLFESSQKLSNKEAKGLWNGWSKEERMTFLNSHGLEANSEHNAKFDWEDRMTSSVENAVRTHGKKYVKLNENINKQKDMKGTKNRIAPKFNPLYESSEATAEVDVLHAKDGEMIVLFNQSEGGDIEIVAVVNPDDNSFITEEELKKYGKLDAYEEAVNQELDKDSVEGDLSESSRKANRKVRMFEAKQRRITRLNEAMSNAELIKSFFREFPQHKKEYNTKRQHNDYPEGVRVDFSDYLNAMAENESISWDQADNVGLGYVGSLNEAMTKTDIVKSFFYEFPEYKKEYKRSRTQGDYPEEIRVMFSDYTDYLTKNGDITEDQADNTELGYVGSLNESDGKTDWENFPAEKKAKFFKSAGLDQGNPNKKWEEMSNAERRIFADSQNPKYADQWKDLNESGETTEGKFKSHKELSDAVDAITEELKKNYENPIEMTWDAVDKAFKDKHGVDWKEEASILDKNFDRLNESSEEVILKEGDKINLDINPNSALDDRTVVEYTVVDVDSTFITLERNGERTRVSWESLEKMTGGRYSSRWGHGSGRLNESHKFGSYKEVNDAFSEVVKELEDKFGEELDASKQAHKDMMRGAFLKKYGVDFIEALDAFRNLSESKKFDSEEDAMFAWNKIYHRLKKEQANDLSNHYGDVYSEFKYTYGKPIGDYVKDFRNLSEGIRTPAIELELEFDRIMAIAEEEAKSKGITDDDDIRELFDEMFEKEHGLDYYSTSAMVGKGRTLKNMNESFNGWDELTSAFDAIYKEVENNSPEDVLLLTADEHSALVDEAFKKKYGVSYTDAYAKMKEKTGKGLFESSDKEDASDKLKRTSYDVLDRAISEMKKKHAEKKLNESADGESFPQVAETRWSGLLPKEINSRSSFYKAIHALIDELEKEHDGNEDAMENSAKEAIEKLYGVDMDDLYALYESGFKKALNESRKRKLNENYSKDEDAKYMRNPALSDYVKEYKEFIAEMPEDDHGFLNYLENIYAVHLDNRETKEAEEFMKFLRENATRVYNKITYSGLNESSDDNDLLKNPALADYARDYKEFVKEVPDADEGFSNYLEGVFSMWMDDDEIDEAKEFYEVLKKGAPKLAKKVAWQLNESKKNRFIKAKNLNESKKRKLNESMNQEGVIKHFLSFHLDRIPEYNKGVITPELNELFSKWKEKVSGNHKFRASASYEPFMATELVFIDGIGDLVSRSFNINESSDDLVEKINTLEVKLDNLISAFSKISDMGSKVDTVLEEAKITKSLFEGVSTQVTKINKTVNSTENIISMNESSQVKAFKAERKYLTNLSEDQVLQVMKMDAEDIEDFEDFIGEEKDRELTLSELSEMARGVNPVLSTILFLN